LANEFEKRILKGEQSTVSVYCDASYFLLYKQTLSGTLSASQTLGAGVEIKRLMASGLSESAAFERRDPLPITIKALYNPAEAYGSYVMPGIIIIILQQALLVGIGMVGGARREKKSSGHYVRFLDKTKHYIPVTIGRALTYFVIYCFNALFVLVYVHHWFGFPDNSLPLQVITLFIPYIFAISFMGLTIAQIFREREHSVMFLVFLSPIVLFISGISWPADAMPKQLHALAHIFPSTSMAPAYLRIRTMGASLQDVQVEFMFLWGLCLFFFTTATWSLKRSYRNV
jgi:ABC-2 type transport system permease protein